MSELVVIEQQSVLAAFSTEDGLQSVINQAKQTVSEFEHDLSTAAGRKRTASLAHKVARLKTTLDGMGKESVADLAARKKAVDANRKAMRDQLDALKEEARKPLTDWEEEQARIEAEEAAKKIQQEIARDHEFALMMNAEFDRKAEEERKAAEEAEQKRIEAERKAQQEREAQMLKEAEERARIEAEQKAKAEQERMERERIAAEERAAQAEREKIAAEERAKAQAELAERQRIEREKQIEQERIAAEESARQQEIDRQKAEQERIAKEQEEREANKRHVGAVRKAAKEALMQFTDEATAKKIVMAINNGEVPSVTISY